VTGAPRDPAAVLGEWYAGEVGGEALFWHLASSAAPEHARTWLALAAVEARTGVRLREALVAANFVVPDVAESLVEARERAGAVANRSWLAQMEWLEDVASDALAGMSADAERLPAPFAALGAVVVAHERALVEFARRERAGETASSLAPIERFLEATAAA
jgi:hypothetical protein